MFKKVVKSLTIGIASLGMFATINAAGNQNETHAATVTSFSQVNQVAQQKLGTPYSFGSVGPTKFDCSGFTKYVMKNGAHKNVKRTAQAQFNGAKHIAKSKIKAGDLVFFGKNKRHIDHVGFAISNTQMIDAQNRGVVTENINAPWWHLVGASRPVNMN